MLPLLLLLLAARAPARQGAGLPLSPPRCHRAPATDGAAVGPTDGGCCVQPACCRSGGPQLSAAGCESAAACHMLQGSIGYW